MARISEQSIEKIRNTADIYEIISAYVELKKKGRNFFGLCPFHGEKTASFSVNTDKQIYKCFGCGEGGSSIDFIMRKHNYDFVEALTYLADKYSIDLEISGSNNKRMGIRTELLEINKYTSEVYYNNLLEPKNKSILEHLNKRGFSNDTIKTFNLGLSFNQWNQLWQSFQQKKYKAESMRQSGLFTDTKKGYIDRFRDRIMFTIHDSIGNPIAFAGRTIKKDENAKYINSSETPLYNKSKVLYGLHETKDDISTLNNAIIVEGYFDFLQLFQAGIKNVVAVSGTSFTDGHAQMLKRLTKNAKIAYDGDSAGISAAIRAGYVLLKNGLNPTIIEIPVGKDPDDWILDSGPDPFLESEKNSISLMRFSYNRFKKGGGNNIASFINDTISELTQIDDSVITEIHLKELSEITGISFESVKQNYESVMNKIYKRQEMQKSSYTKPDNNSLSIEDDLIMLCFSKEKEIRQEIYNNFNFDWIINDNTRRIYNEIYIHLNSKFEPQAEIVIDQLKEKEDKNKLAGLLSESEKINPSIEMAKNAINRLHHNHLIEKMETLREQLKNSEQDFQDSSELINEISDIQSTINDLKKSG
tara:strand:- start:977 stop:2737 length:1761 start_codon:yes stop_codon:yes gene_type:complete